MEQKNKRLGTRKEEQNREVRRALSYTEFEHPSPSTKIGPIIYSRWEQKKYGKQAKGSSARESSARRRSA